MDHHPASVYLPKVRGNDPNFDLHIIIFPNWMVQHPPIVAEHKNQFESYLHEVKIPSNFTKNFRYLRWRNTHLYKLYVRLNVRETPTPKQPKIRYFRTSISGTWNGWWNLIHIFEMDWSHHHVFLLYLFFLANLWNRPLYPNFQFSSHHG